MWSSSTVNCAGPRVTLPVLTTVYVYVMTSPTGSYVAGLADFRSASDRCCVARAVAVSGGESTAPPEAWAVFETVPASTSAWLSVYSAVHATNDPAEGLPTLPVSG